MSTPPNEDSAGAGLPFVDAADRGERTRNLAHALALIPGAFVVAGVIQQAGLSVLGGVGVTEESAPVLTQLVPMSLHFTGFLLVCGAYLAWRGDPGLVRLDRPTAHDLRWIMLGFSVLVALLVGLELLLSQFGLEPADNVAVEAGTDNPQLFLYFVPLVILLNAPAEELLFRGVVQGLFRRSYGVVPAIVLAALLFGLVHYVALVGDGSPLVYVLIAFVSGLVLGALYEYTENLAVPIAVHACWNIIVYLNLYASTTGLL